MQTADSINSIVHISYMFESLGFIYTVAPNVLYQTEQVLAALINVSAQFCNIITLQLLHIITFKITSQTFFFLTWCHLKDFYGLEM